MLRRGEFAVTTELNPPDSADPEDVYNRAKIFDGWVDAINAVDASGANCHMSSVGICALLTRMGYAPIMQIACRDKNRIAIQGDVLGGAAMGVANMLCLTGDGVQAGDQPGAKPVFDLDSHVAARDLPHHARQRQVPVRPQADDAAADFPRRRRSTRSRRPSISARSIWARRSPPARSSCRASTASTCRCSAPSCRRSRDLGYTEKCFILCGVGPLASAKTAKWIRSNVPGIHIPDSIIKRLEGAQDQKKEGKQLCIDIINEVKEIPGVVRHPCDGLSPGGICRRDRR